MAQGPAAAVNEVVSKCKDLPPLPLELDCCQEPAARVPVEPSARVPALIPETGAFPLPGELPGSRSRSWLQYPVSRPHRAVFPVFVLPVGGCHPRPTPRQIALAPPRSVQDIFPLHHPAAVHRSSLAVLFPATRAVRPFTRPATGGPCLSPSRTAFLAIGHRGDFAATSQPALSALPRLTGTQVSAFPRFELSGSSTGPVFVSRTNPIVGAPRPQPTRVVAALDPACGIRDGLGRALLVRLPRKRSMNHIFPSGDGRGILGAC